MAVELPPTVAGNWKFFVNAQLWPRAARFDPKGWLENFDAADQKYAIRLLEGFTYFADELVGALFQVGQRRRGRPVCAEGGGARAPAAGGRLRLATARPACSFIF